MSEERTMLGGSHWKIIREDILLPKELESVAPCDDEEGTQYRAHALHCNCDLYVSPDLFDLIEGIIESDGPGPCSCGKADKTPTEEIQYLGQMLTATTERDVGRLESIVLRLRNILFTAAEYTIDGQWKGSV